MAGNEVLGKAFENVPSGMIYLTETFIHYILVVLNPGTVTGGRPVSGPRWRIPNGHIIDKFMHGTTRSIEWSKKYGSVYRIWAGEHPEIVITTPQLLRDFHSDGDKHGKPQYSNLGWYLGQVLGSCIGLLEGPDWKQQRQIFDPAFRHSATVALIGDTDRAAKDFIDNLPVAAKNIPQTTPQNEKSQNQQNLEFPIIPAFQKFPFFLAARVIYGPMTEAEEDDLWALAEKRLSLAPYLFIGGPYRYRWGKWIDHTAFGRLQDFSTQWRKYNERIVKSRRSNGAAAAPILTYWNALENGEMTMENLMHTLDEMLMTNLDVTTHVVTWFITLVADHSEVKRELLAEIEDNWENLNEYLVKSDNHLHRCFQEALRLRSPLSFSAGESAPSVKNFDGILVKPNTMVLVDVNAINIRNAFWGKDSEEFRPSRFKGIKPSDLRYNLVLFGFNGRKCPGQYLGAQMSKALLVHLLRGYEVDVIKGQKGQNSYETDKSTWVPMADVTLRLTKRE
ncbi:cytochrome P450 [Coniella lustricola]|uniref:Cytochrome P450 n=1 Tax=Coniella lustricola TaxID=2025994 RepID=A0A2T2ZUS2_9PEZI|nr:cytochrome P450 [Coniella lustricola]